MTESYKKLIATLEEIFQLDQADLDFGIYRIMNQKRTEINDFLQNKLLVQVDDILAHSSAGDTKDLKKELENLENTLRSAGIDPETTPKVIELRAQYQSAGSPEALSNEVFSHLTSFFRRYYNEGDFISQRRYKNDVYAIPYEGEEVKLYWANYDQYYIKTSENFKNFTFKTDDGRTVHFRLREASTEHNNNKAQRGKERRFKITEENTITIENNELSIWFTYEPQDKKEAQADLNKTALSFIFQQLPASFKSALIKNMPTKTNPGRTLIEKHLNDYTSSNTFDYFIHKNLGSFLNHELDFYIKNEILNIDDINLDLPQVFDKQLKVIKALKSVAQKVIALMAQLEDFQKKLWLKKKFVIQADYCITLDRVPESFYPEIITNLAQINEWISLFALDEIEADVITIPFTLPLTVDFLKANSFLIIDTQFFSREWKYNLLSEIDHVDEQCDGLLINSENFQALNLIHKRYKGRARSIYIDPPYNTDAGPINYKNNFRDSSWMTLLNDRILLGKDFLDGSGILCCTIDDYEHKNLGLILEQIFEDVSGTVAIRIKPSGRPIPNGFAVSHEYALFAKKQTSTPINRLTRDDEQMSRYREIDEKGNFFWEMLRKAGSNSTNLDRPTMYYPLLVSENNTVRLPKMTYDPINEVYINIEQQLVDEIVVWPTKDSGAAGCWYFGYDNMKLVEKELKAVKQDNGNLFIYYRRRPNEGVQPTTVWIDAKYSATEHGTALLKKLFKEHQPFSYPKSIYAVEDCLKVSGSTKPNSLIIDYFAGSGTTGHAVINLNRADQGNRKYILVEMGTYFNTVTKPRIQKVIYSKDWKDGKPLSTDGISHCFKYMRLESFEDTLNNLQLMRSGPQQSLLENTHFGEEYLLHYMLDVESRESLLNAEMFNKPFGFNLKVTENNELKKHEVDLVETFNYLLGLIVESMQIIKGTVVVQGKNLQGEKILIIWRDIAQTDNAALNEFFRKLNINTRDSEFKRIYVNGDNNLENLRTDDEQWKVVLIEEAFHKLMFEANEV